MTAPFARWRESVLPQPGLLPSREKLAALQPDTLISLRADVLLQLVVQAERHDAPCGHLAATESDEHPLPGSRARGSGETGLVGGNWVSLAEKATM